jgi:hypothetical protein
VIGIRQGKLYRLMFQLAQALIHSSSIDLCELWHRRMAHLHHGAFNVLKEIVTGLPEFSVDHQVCALGKYSKIAFPGSDNRSKGILDMIHSDVCGPMSVVSLSGYRYYVTFLVTGFGEFHSLSSKFAELHANPNLFVSVRRT